LKCCQLIQQRQLAAECTVFGDNSATEFREFHKLCRGIWQNVPRNLAKFAAEKRWPRWYSAVCVLLVVKLMSAVSSLSFLRCCCCLLQCGYESARVVVYLDVQLPVRPFGATTQAYGSVVSMASQCQLWKLVTAARQLVISWRLFVSICHLGVCIVLTVQFFKRHRWKHQQFCLLWKTWSVRLSSVCLSVLLPPKAVGWSDITFGRDPGVVQSNIELWGSLGQL